MKISFVKTKQDAPDSSGYVLFCTHAQLEKQPQMTSGGQNVNMLISLLQSGVDVLVNKHENKDVKQMLVLQEVEGWSVSQRCF